MRSRTFLVCLLLAPSSAAPAKAWFTVGHHMASEAAVAVLPTEVPEFFRQGGAAVAHASVDPDVLKDRSQPQLRSQEGPEHYLDIELLGGRDLPEDRYRYLELLAWLRVEPAREGYRVRDLPSVGLLPYTVVEGTQKLTLAFAEHRRWPDNPHIRSKALLYAGLLAHYAGDLCQPLHTTVHHNGRAHPDGTSPSTGIHGWVDGLFERVSFDRRRAVTGVQPRVLDDLFADVMARFHDSFGRVDAVYALEAALDPQARDWPAPEVVELTAERYRATVRFIASLFLTAWRRSAEVELPGWLEREAYGSPATVSPR